MVTAKSLGLPPTRPRENDVGGAWLAMVTRCRNREMETVSDTFNACYGREMTQGGNNAVWECQPCNVCRPAEHQPCERPQSQARPPTKDRSTGGRHQEAPKIARRSILRYGTEALEAMALPSQPSCTRFEYLKLSTMIFGGFLPWVATFRPPRCTEWPFRRHIRHTQVGL